MNTNQNKMKNESILKYEKVHQVHEGSVLDISIKTILWANDELDYIL